MKGAIGAVLRLPARVFYGWWIVLAGCVINAIGGGIYIYGFTVFFLPLSESLNIGRASTSLVFALSRLEAGVQGPVAGWMIDRFGPRRLMVIGGILAGLGYILLSRTGSYLTFLLVYLGVLSLGFNAGFMQGALAAVNQWFVRRRALAMSAIIAAFAAGGALVTPVLSLAVLHLGWRTAAVLSGLVILTVVVPLCFLVRRSPESMGLLPDGAPAREEPSRSARARGGPRPAPPAEFTVREAAGTPTYWLLAVATALRIAVHGAIIIHFVPLLVWKGLDRQAAANLVGLLAFLSIPLRLTFGYFGDLWPKNRALALGLIPGSLGLLVLLLAGEVWHFYLFVLLFVLAEGVSPLNWALISDLFGRRSFATLRGIMTSFISLGMVVTPVFAGWVFDHTMSYRGALIPFIAIFLVSALIY